MNTCFFGDLVCIRRGDCVVHRGARWRPPFESPTIQGGSWAEALRHLGFGL